MIMGIDDHVTRWFAPQPLCVRLLCLTAEFVC
jgi:hypothetical protein